MLTDFGVAHVVGGATLTRTGDVVGTLAYMAPEQADGHEAGPEADLYALALVLYEALTGVNPQASSHRRTTFVPPLRRQRRDLSRHLAAGIDTALRPRPQESGVACSTCAPRCSTAWMRPMTGPVSSRRAGADTRSTTPGFTTSRGRSGATAPTTRTHVAPARSRARWCGSAGPAVGAVRPTWLPRGPPTPSAPGSAPPGYSHIFGITRRRLLPWRGSPPRLWR